MHTWIMIMFATGCFEDILQICNHFTDRNVVSRSQAIKLHSIYLMLQESRSPKIYILTGSRQLCHLSCRMGAPSPSFKLPFLSFPRPTSSSQPSMRLL